MWVTSGEDSNSVWGGLWGGAHDTCVLHISHGDTQTVCISVMAMFNHHQQHAYLASDGCVGGT